MTTQNPSDPLSKNCDTPFVSVIILNHNGQAFLQSCIDSIERSHYPSFEIVLVDNASTDASITTANEQNGKYGNISIVRNNSNFGFAEGNNIGATHAKGDLLIFINNDTEVQPDWMQHLVRTALGDTLVGIVVPRVVWTGGPKGLLVGNVDKLGSSVLVDLRSERISQRNSRTKAGSDPRQSHPFETIAAGPAFLIKRRVWEKIGGFDPKYFIYAEDIDLSWRARLLGYRTVLDPDSFVRHKIAGTTRKVGLHERRYLTYRNTLRTLIKVYSTPILSQVILPFLAIRIGEAFTLSVLTNNPRILVGLLRAVTWNIRHFEESWGLHSKVQKTRTVSEKEIQSVIVGPTIPKPGAH